MTDFIGWNELIQKTKMSETCIRSWIKKDNFPKWELVDGKKVWKTDLIDRWQQFDLPEIKKKMRAAFKNSIQRRKFNQWNKTDGTKRS